MYASGSTWLFNAARKIAAVCGLQTGLASAFVAAQAELTFPAGTTTAIVKTHDTDAATAGTLATESRAIWLSVRDPRDCVTSLMLYQDCNFDEALDMTVDAAQAVRAVLDHPRTTLFQFESFFFDDPHTLDLIAGSFGCALAADDKARIYTETRRSAIESLIKRFPEISTVVTQPEPGHLVDLDTQWHTHHAGRDGAVGRWRTTLTADRVAAIEHRLQGLMNRLGYRAGPQPLQH